ncbi:MAG: SctK family type III secretion system sorting platform protein [Endozoicomonadaceae bacterium]|nr:SctK family type III secretion system sorting platform protein [Endozoicomonadaceae bacterium]MBE8232896.1 SctK family type III secretion system sorting platform protein [Endozoicomonadaceae bacterium]
MKAHVLAEQLSFNYAIADYIDASWLAETDYEDILQTLQANPDSQQWVSLYFLQHYDLEQLPDFDFENPLKLIAFQSRHVLIQVIFYAGLTLNHNLFRQVIKRIERKALEDCLGDVSYQFVIKRAPLMSGQLTQLLPCHFKINWQQVDDIKKHIFRSGIRLLGTVFFNESEGYKKRLLFKFPVPSQEYFYAGCAEQDAHKIQKLGAALFKKLLKEFAS